MTEWLGERGKIDHPSRPIDRLAMNQDTLDRAAALSVRCSRPTGVAMMALSI
jgi:hypothetical protein